MTAVYLQPGFLGMPPRQIVRRDLSSQCDGNATTFATPEPYLGGTLQVAWNGLDCGDNGGEFDETGLNTFSMDEAPEAGASLVVRYMPLSVTAAAPGGMRMQLP